MKLRRELFSTFCAYLMYIIILIKPMTAVAFIQQILMSKGAYIGCWCREAVRIPALWELAVKEGRRANIYLP